MVTADIIRRVKEIQIRTGRHVADVLAGEYVSVFRGSGIEFEEVRPYQPGDDVRSIDWNVTARAGSPFVKRYVEERQLTLMLMADVSASQDFGSVERSKREATAEFCALLAFSAIRNDDKVGLTLFHGQVEQYIPARKGQKHALRVVREVLAHEQAAMDGAPPKAGWLERLKGALPGRRPRDARQATDISKALEFMMSVNKRRTVCFVVSDFLDEGFESALSQANRRHDVVAVLVTDPRELELPRVGVVAMTDAETGQTRLQDTSSQAFQKVITARAAERIESLRTRLERRGVDLIHIDTAESVVEPLVRFFRNRERKFRR
ncbi:MAG: DUF58 domain-containing protein [Chromatiales bacterium]|jgi:uncharacterized protein (DUF58 family)|nr:DUF58 domain-containing protein [Chromatiales bacterium]